MAITLSDITLRGGLVWVDRWTQQKVAQTVQRTLGGNPVFYHATLRGGMPISLESLDDQGWQTLDTVERLRELASVTGGQYLLDLDGIQHSVMFRHIDEPAFEATPLIPRTLADVGDYFTIKLKLITV